MNPHIGIVTVLYNSETVLADYFYSLSKQSYRDFSLYIIDNKSPDQSLSLSVELARCCGFKVVIIENDSNAGVAKGNNIGIEKAIADGCDFVLLSNNDVIFEPSTIEVLLDGLVRNNAVMAVPKIYYYGTNQFWAAGGSFHKRSGLNLHRGLRQIDTGQYQKEERITFAPTCFMLLRKDIFSRIGMMDEVYFVYWDDTDFMYRAYRQNESLWYIPGSLVYHKESVSTGASSDFSIRYLYRNFIYFALKNYSFGYAWYVILYNIIYHLFIKIFKMPFSKWWLGLKSYGEGFVFYKRSYAHL